jgi:hypothetical protein
LTTIHHRFGSQAKRAAAIGYQGILDALPEPSDDEFLGCRQHWPEAAFFLQKVGILDQTLG